VRRSTSPIIVRSNGRVRGGAIVASLGLVRPRYPARPGRRSAFAAGVSRDFVAGLGADR
jgi:hypothetical protein